MREPCCLWLSAADRARLAAIVADRNSPQKHVWRARIVLLSAERLGTVGDHAPGRAWPRPASGAGRQRFWRPASTGCCATRPGSRGMPPLAATVVERVVALHLRRAARARRPTGPARAMAKASRHLACLGAADLGARTGCSRTGCGPSSSPRTRRSPPSCATWSGSMSTRRRHAVVLSVDEKSPCVDGPRLARGWLSIFAAGCLQSCVRPRSRPTRTAGPDGFRGSGPQQILGLATLDFSRLPPIRRCNRPRHRSPSLASFRLAALTYAAAAAW